MSSLSATLLERAPPGARNALAEVPEADLVAMAKAARAAWPTVELPDHELIAYVAERLPPDATGATLRALRTADLYLACGCAGGSPAALAAFDAAYFADVDVALRRAGDALGLADEVRQMVREKLFVAKD